MNRELAKKILVEFDAVSKRFGDFQKESGLHCPTGCGQCCFNPDVSCNPFELLPLALDLLERNQAEIVLELAKNHVGKNCILLEVTDEQNGKGFCRQYPFRPFVCRIFGVAGRKNKVGKTEYSVCRKLKELPEYSEFKDRQFDQSPLIEEWRQRMVSLAPELLGAELPINQAIVAILEKALLWNSYNGEMT